MEVDVDMDHNESIRKFEQLMMRESGHAHEAAIELEALVAMLPGVLLGRWFERIAGSVPT